MHLVKILNNKVKVVGGLIKVISSAVVAWILDLSSWDDNGIWKDNSTWND